MRRIRLFGTLAGGAVVVACGASGQEAPSTASLTAARDIAAARGDSAPSSSAVALRLAYAMCLHEVNCGRPQTRDCIDAASNKVRAAVSGWKCSDAATRARVEECLASIPTEACEIDVTMRANVCPVSVACANLNVELVSPGTVLDEPWAR